MKENSYVLFPSFYDCATEPSDNFLRILKKIPIKKNDFVLEIGCGTGKYTLPLAEKEFKVTAVDSSKEMITIAKSKAKKRKLKIQFINKKIQELRINKEFDFALSSDCINSIIDKEDLKKSFEIIYKCLKKRGIFIFDFETKKFMDLQAANSGYGGRKEKDFFVWEDYLIGNFLEMKISIFKNKKRNLFERKEETYIKRFYSEKELKKMLDEIGFKKIRIFGEKLGKIKKNDEIRYLISEK